MPLDKFKEFISDAGLVSAFDLKPCSEEEVQQIEHTLGFSLPTTYREFLLYMGHGAGCFLRGSEFHCREVPDLQIYAKELLQENNFPEALPTDALVFCMHQGYLFYFLRIDQGDASPVYGYCEGKTKLGFDMLYNSFEEFLFAGARDYITIRQPLNGTKEL